ncbi:type II toxin-antitoxin system HigB family toxin [Bartonella bacilliformis]|uniref:type II toxin-antitoxin system HigB family toxin n=1 Tax=Bartonella bacilliformis TaxID=774 RepID=UPI00049EDF2C|nr:type II toxin-antitoxin system HigB family toxin [Bartonella bacilliformis]KEG16381.1 hypothetical protein H705_00245 [Bartonella bacilliformis Cond044]
MQYPDAEQPLKAWIDEAKNAQWRSPHDIKEKYKNASILKNNRVVFNIKGNEYRFNCINLLSSGMALYKIHRHA